MCSSISEVYDTHECYVLVMLDLPRIAELHLHVSARTARDAMLAAPKLKIRETDVHMEGEPRRSHVRPGGLPTVTYRLRAPASCVLRVPEAQGSLLPGRQARHVRRTRTSSGRIAPRPTYGVPYRGTSGEARLKVYAGSQGGRAEATGGHVFELQRLQRALMQVVFCFHLY